MEANEFRYCPEHWTRTTHINIDGKWVCAKCHNGDRKDKMNRRAMYDRAIRGSVHQST